MTAKVIEILDDTQVIISLGGDLVRAENETGRSLKKGDLVSMSVSNVEPLKLRLVDGRRNGRLDIIT